MGDIITLAHAATAKPDANNVAFQNILESVDVSAYDSIDFQVALLATTGSPTSVVIAVITAVENESEDAAINPAIWPVANQTLISAAPYYGPLVVPNVSTAPLFRYIRWKVTFIGGTNPTAIFSLSGIARRGVRR